MKLKTTEYQVIKTDEDYKIGISNQLKIKQLVKKFNQESAKNQSTQIIYQCNQMIESDNDNEKVELK